VSRSAIAQREAHGMKPLGNTNSNRDVIYNTDGRGVKQGKDPGSRWRWDESVRRVVFL
jgi:hypothetical protein